MTLALQAIWRHGKLYVWALAPSPGDAPAQPALPDALRALVGELCSDALLASAAPQADLPIRFPGQPQVTSVPALGLDASQAIDLLTSLPHETSPCCGDSVIYWAALARFVCSLIALRQFVPRVEETPAGLRAAWRVLVSDKPQLHWLERMAGAMPPVCLAANGSSPAPSDAARLVEDFLAATADALIRRALSDDSFFQDVQQRSQAPDAQPEMRWVGALLGDDAAVQIQHPEDEAQFYQQARAWLAQLDESSPAAMRLTMVLHEPPETADEQGNEFTQADAPWVLTLHLEGIDGEGELIDADALWRDSQEHAPIMGRSVARRREALLAELARAGELYPPAQALLSQTAPSQITLSTTDAHGFIRHWAPLLRERGFGVIVPQWASLPADEVGLALVLDPLDDDELLDIPGPSRRSGFATGESLDLASGHFGLDSLTNFNWQVALGDLRLSPHEFEQLVSRSTPLVRHNKRWVQIDLDAARKAVEFMKQTPSGNMTLAQAFRTAFTASKAQTGLNIIGLSGKSWIGQLLEQAPVGNIEQIPQPASFDGTLRPYQLRGLQWLIFLDRLGLGACLADDMGLGKTIQFIALLLQEREKANDKGGRARPELVEGMKAESDGVGCASAHHVPLPSADAGATSIANRQSPIGHSSDSSFIPHPSSLLPGPTLLFAPTSVVGNWLREIQRFAPSIKTLVHHGPQRLSGDDFVKAASNCDVVITSYSLAHRDRDEIEKIKWWRIALDEAQKIKNPAAASTLAIRSFFAPRRVALTGTPIENHLSELWSIMQVLNPGLLGTAADFREKFAVPIEKLGEKERAEQLRRMIKPFVLRRTKADPAIAGDLPEKLEMKVFCNLTAQQAAIYQRLVADSLRQIDSSTGMRRRGLILATLTRLKQVCNHPALLEKDASSLDHRSGKCERLIDMLEELLEEGDAALVFTQFREMGHLLEKMIRQRLGSPTLFLHGGTPAKNRDTMIQQFQAQESGGPRIFLLSLRAGGLGLNLTAANHVFHFDRWWNPAVEQQATDRAHRVGQTRTVQVHKFVCIGTMEERIDRLLTEKMALAQQIVGAGDEWLTEMSTEQLRQYLTLSQEAVGDE